MMIFRWRQVAVPAMGLLLAAMVGCSDNGTDPTGGGGTGATVSFAADLQPAFNLSCLNCHGPGGSGGLELTAGVAWANLVGVESQNYAPRQRVMIANPNESVLYLKLDGAPGVGGRMPIGGALNDVTIEKFRVWILEGALDN